MSISKATEQDAPIHVLVIVAATLAALAGCGGDQFPVVPVTGTITLNGAPLEGALVEFQPLDMQGSPSYGATDAAGKYELVFSQSRKGAWVGEHVVRISTRNENERIREKLPPSYHADSDIKREVTADGENVLDFNIDLNAAAE